PIGLSEANAAAYMPSAPICSGGRCLAASSGRKRKQALAPPTDKMSGVRATHDVHFMDADLFFFADALEHALRPRSLHSGLRKLHRATHAGRHAHARRSMGGRFGGSNTGRAVSAVELAKIAFSDLTSVDASSFRRERVLGGEQRRRVGPEQDAPRAPAGGIPGGGRRARAGPGGWIPEARAP